MIRKSVYRRFILYFIMFGMCIITLFLFLISQSEKPILENSIRDAVAFQQKHIFSVLQKFSFSATHVVDTLVNSREINNYLSDPEKAELVPVNRLIKNIIGIDPSFYRAELLDRNNEVLLSVYRQDPRLQVQDDITRKGVSLQFIPKLSSKVSHQIWFSEIIASQHLFSDSAFFHLLYASYPLYTNHQYAGSVVVYFNIDNLLNFLTSDDRLDIYITDQKGKILFSSDQMDSVTQGETQFFQSTFEVSDIRSEQQLKQKGFSFMPLGALYNGQGLLLFCRASSSFLQEKSDWYNAVVVEIFVIVIIFSFCFGIIIAIGPSRTVEKLKTVSKEKNKYMRLLDQYVPVFETDRHGVITRCNQAFCLLSQFSESELIGKPSTILNFNQADSSIAHIKSILDAGLPWQGEVHYISKRGKEFWLFSTVIPIYGNHRELMGYMSISTDKTDKKQLEVMLEIDSLTEIYNRSKLNKCLSHEFERTKRYGTVCSVIMIDIDFFKQVNDNFGHFMGDKVLYQLAILLNQSTRMIDEVGRWGGEEFMIVCPETTLEDALILAEKIRATIASHDFSDVGRLTVSLGVAEMEPEKTLQSILEQADYYLYEAKNKGRNCVMSRMGYFQIADKNTI
ncbi:Response regulator PleD [Vibrio aerogenes CECT 7868]|uniref:diguanylate cyclase n=1 Tax=Vibrio aerogenes CECT 7868 TaxID=1216006 RepID=A0A1M5ZJZ9_9VIBR|nr:sensor domain-containing diguanylate cyclase [Vibrio aerogenes]SHI24675.1 Response regulator PleD [Vibrio aerogenes CECT 7868]